MFLDKYGTSDTQKVDKVVGPNDPNKPGLEGTTRNSPPNQSNAM
jgi:hypothetical protein